MSADTIYLVCGDVGEYSDRSTWIVAWYPTEDEAKAHVTALDESNIVAREKLEAWFGEEDCDYADDKRAAILATPLDPQREAYCGSLPTYSVAKIERGKWPFDLPPRGTHASPVSGGGR